MLNVSTLKVYQKLIKALKLQIQYSRKNFVDSNGKYCRINTVIEQEICHTVRVPYNIVFADEWTAPEVRSLLGMGLESYLLKHHEIIDNLSLYIADDDNQNISHNKKDLRGPVAIIVSKATKYTYDSEDDNGNEDMITDWNKVEFLSHTDLLVTLRQNMYEDVFKKFLRLQINRVLLNENPNQVIKDTQKFIILHGLNLIAKDTSLYTECNGIPFFYIKGATFIKDNKKELIKISKKGSLNKALVYSINPQIYYDYSYLNLKEFAGYGYDSDGLTNYEADPKQLAKRLIYDFYMIDIDTKRRINETNPY